VNASLYDLNFVTKPEPALPLDLIDSLEKTLTVLKPVHTGARPGCDPLFEEQGISEVKSVSLNYYRMVEPTGIEPATFSLRTRRSTN
jgi:hypothetical protein